MAAFVASFVLVPCSALASPQDSAPKSPQEPPADKPQLTVEQRLEALEKATEWRLDAPDNFKVYWKDGLRLTSNNKKYELRIGGRLQFDGEWNEADDDLEATRRYNGNAGDATAANTAAIGPLEDGWEIRRARINLAGNLYEHVEFVLQFDFAKGATQEKDVYAGLYDLGDWIPNVRAGHQYEPFGLDAITSDFESTFIERALPSTTFAPSRNPGFLAWKNWKVDNEERLTWAAGVFREDANDNGVASGDGAYAVTARITGTPFWQEKGKRMLHLGAAATRRSVAGRGSESVTFASRPEADQLNFFASTGSMKEADVDWRYGVESAFVWNSMSLQGEYILTKTDLTNGSTLDDPSFHGWYVQAAWTITGENRRWKPADATFQSPRPSANAFDNGGAGAWEVAARFSSLDLTDGNKATGGVQGGSMTAATLGLNWYLNPNTKVMWDLTHADLDTDDPALGKGGGTNILQMRVQFAF
jgi:phosphate-selective porin OprO/OprP